MAQTPPNVPHPTTAWNPESSASGQAPTSLDAYAFGLWRLMFATIIVIACANFVLMWLLKR